MERLKALQTEAKNALAAADAIRDRYKGAEAMSAEDSAAFDAAMNKYDDLMTNIAAEQRAVNAERVLATPAGEFIAPAATDATDEAKRKAEGASKFTVEQTLKAYNRFLLHGERGLRGEDAEVIRAYQADNDQEGGYLVAPQEMVSGLLKALDDEVFIRQFATKYTVVRAESLGVVTLESDVDDPIWTSELATGDEDDGLRLGKRALFPHPVAKRIKVSRKLLRQATIDPGNLLITRMTRKFGTVEENVFLTGTGHEQPLGLFTAHADGIPTTRDVITGSQTGYTADGLINALYELKGPYRRNARWLLHRESLREIRKLKYSDGTYIWSSGLDRDGEPTILGRPYIESEFAPNTFTNGNYGAVLGDLSFYWIVDALDVQFQVLNELYATTNQIGYIGRKEMDAQPVMAEAFVRLKFATS